MSEKGRSNRPREGQTPEDAASRNTLRPPHSAAETVDFQKLVPSLATPVSVPLGRLESTVFMRIDGRRSVHDIAIEVGLAPYEVLRILERLMSLVPALRVGQTETVELSVDDLWEDAPDTNDRTAELVLPESARNRPDPTE
jgi:hypothetical protein